jgi:hypothetical protein
MPTVSVFMPNMSGATGLSLYLRKTSDYSLINAGGDPLTEASSSGWFTANVDETWTEQLSATVVDGDGLIPFGGWLGVGSTIVSDISSAQINAEVLDVLSVDTFSELNAPPAATSSLKDKLIYLFMWAKNKATETSTQRKLFADNGTTVVSTETVGDDGTTFTKGKAS